MKIDYTEVVRNYLEPKLGYLGFKYSEEKSHPPMGVYQFVRYYWGATQSIIIGRIEYNKEDLENAFKEGDIATEVPTDSLLIKDPGYRLWLSNKYIRAILSHNGNCISIHSDDADRSISFTEVNTFMEESLMSGRTLAEKREWWVFRDTATLQLKLNEIYKRMLRDGLDWFEQQVADVRRYHEKLDLRRATIMEKCNRNGEVP